ncbi:MAG: hypothetical protein HYT22_00745 [Candidatus Niyogibacteria bacterium]|nr:hypothetical protein [Candidatus Niyogibacteria bacterium]
MTYEEVNFTARPGETGDGEEELEGGSEGYESGDPFTEEDADEAKY